MSIMPIFFLWDDHYAYVSLCIMRWLAFFQFEVIIFYRPDPACWYSTQIHDWKWLPLICWSPWYVHGGIQWIFPMDSCYTIARLPYFHIYQDLVCWKREMGNPYADFHGVPQGRWMVSMENPIYKWMMTRAIPVTSGTCKYIIITNHHDIIFTCIYI